MPGGDGLQRHRLVRTLLERNECFVELPQLRRIIKLRAADHHECIKGHYLRQGLPILCLLVHVVRRPVQTPPVPGVSVEALRALNKQRLSLLHLGAHQHRDHALRRQQEPDLLLDVAAVEYTAADVLVGEVSLQHVFGVFDAPLLMDGDSAQGQRTFLPVTDCEWRLQHLPLDRNGPYRGALHEPLEVVQHKFAMLRAVVEHCRPVYTGHVLRGPSVANAVIMEQPEEGTRQQT
mmetsp:Transcript_49671/g.81720  ORF Transcript_49671/g.81720 Transcript_49671/m.81720 type:complete len:234 (+) Transcript_49671:1063-1764(+)